MNLKSTDSLICADVKLSIALPLKRCQALFGLVGAFNYRDSSLRSEWQDLSFLRYARGQALSKAKDLNCPDTYAAKHQKDRVELYFYLRQKFGIIWVIDQFMSSKKDVDKQNSKCYTATVTFQNIERVGYDWATWFEMPPDAFIDSCWEMGICLHRRWTLS